MLTAVFAWASAAENSGTNIVHHPSTGLLRAQVIVADIKKMHNSRSLAHAKNPCESPLEFFAVLSRTHLRVLSLKTRRLLGSFCKSVLIPIAGQGSAKPILAVFFTDRMALVEFGGITDSGDSPCYPNFKTSIRQLHASVSASSETRKKPTQVYLCSVVRGEHRNGLLRTPSAS